MIIQFENWFADEFEAPGIDQLPKATINMESIVGVDRTQENSIKEAMDPTPLYEGKQPA